MSVELAAVSGFLLGHVYCSLACGGRINMVKEEEERDKEIVFSGFMFLAS